MIACVPTTRSTSPAAISCSRAARWLGRQAAGQLGAADLAGGQHAFERQGMLPGEDFRGGHQHRLVAVGDRQQHGVDGHHRLAAAHVALQQPVHRQRAGHVGGNLGDRLLLARGQLEGEQPADAGVDLGRGLQRRGLPLVVLLLPPHGQRQLQDEQAPDRPAAAGRGPGSPGRWENGSAATPAAAARGRGPADIRRERLRRARRRTSRAPRGRSSASAIAASPRSADRPAAAS